MIIINLDIDNIIEDVCVAAVMIVVVIVILAVVI
jgi:hypothetical protein